MVLNFTLIVPFEKLSTLLQDRDREVRELLRVVHQLFVRRAVQLARALDQQLRRVVLAGDPRAAVDHDHLVGAVLRDDPGADHRLERRRRLADRLLAQIDLDVGRVQRRRRRPARHTDRSPSAMLFMRCLLRTKKAPATTSAGQMP